MADEQHELREQMEQRRQSIAGTVDEIEDRVSPSRIAARGTNRIRRRLTDLADTVFGNDEPDYEPRSARYRSTYDASYGVSRSMHTPTRSFADTGPSRQQSSAGDRFYDETSGDSMLDRAKEMVPSADEVRRTVPSGQDVRRQTRGNPLAAGMISFGAGLLLGSVLPESRRERELARQAQPHLDDAASEAATIGRSAVDELEQPARDAIDDVRSTAADHARGLKDEAADKAGDIKDAATS